MLDYREILRLPTQPDVQIGEVIQGMEVNAEGKCVSIEARVVRVRLEETHEDGSLTFAVLLRCPDGSR